MDLYDAMHTSASGLSAQRLRMNLISANLANVNTTRTPEGGPYRRKEVVFSAVPKGASFRDHLKARPAKAPCEVRPLKIIEDQRPAVVKYAPHHPDANPEGYVALPQINVMEEMVNMISASRSYQNNVEVLNTSKSLLAKTLGIGN